MDPTLKTKTLSKLRRLIPELSPALRKCAKYVVDQPSEFGLDTVRDTARKCGVSTNTFVRLSLIMGFDGFNEMREPFRHALVSSTLHSPPGEWLDDLRNRGVLGQIRSEAAANTLAIVQRSLERQVGDQMERIAAMLLDARDIYLTSMRASYSLAYFFHYVGRMALPSLHLVPRHMSSAIDDLHLADHQDVMMAITFSPYSLETIEACRFAVSNGVKLILVSDSDVVSSEFQADETIVVSTDSTHHFSCYSGALATLENLLALLVTLRGKAAEERIKSYELLRQENKAYWSAPKKR